ncbi:hypothetical protein HOY80DRAFT_15237 [Tuber brumale]|nr:hypothetical protein HOY80DRAFT_15237 [Tuber brumale]
MNVPPFQLQGSLTSGYRYHIIRYWNNIKPPSHYCIPAVNHTTEKGWKMRGKGNVSLEGPPCLLQLPRIIAPCAPPLAQPAQVPSAKVLFLPPPRHDTNGTSRPWHFRAPLLTGPLPPSCCETGSDRSLSDLVSILATDRTGINYSTGGILIFQTRLVVPVSRSCDIYQYRVPPVLICLQSELLGRVWYRKRVVFFFFFFFLILNRA